MSCSGPHDPKRSSSVHRLLDPFSRGWRHRIRSGGLVSQGNCTYGYDYVPKTTTSRCAIAVNEREADIVRWIFEAYANGTGMLSITRNLEERGIPTKRGKTLWRKDKILYMLKNHVYAGIRELHELKREKAEYIREIPLLHKESVDLSIRQFCDAARARFERCTSFETKQQFLAAHVERVIYDRYRVTVVGSVPVKTQMSETQEIEIRKLEFCLRGEIDKTTLHKTKPRKKFAEDGQMDGGRKAPTISAIPVCSVPSLTAQH